MNLLSFCRRRWEAESHPISQIGLEVYYVVAQVGLELKATLLFQSPEY